jgi:hypothetical protein
VGYFCNFKKLLKVNSHTIGKNSPNLITLDQPSGSLEPEVKIKFGSKLRNFFSEEGVAAQLKAHF